MELFNADCFDILPELKDNSVDMFLLDLPYNQTNCKWDKDIIDLEKMWIQIKRIMKPNAIIVMFCTVKFGYRLIHSNPKWFRYDLIWKKSRKVGFLSANKMPLRQHENIYIFKEKLGTYNPQKTKGEPYKKKEIIENECVYKNKEENYKRTGGVRFDRHPTSIIENKVLGQNYYRNENQKPLFRVKENKDERHPTSVIENTVLEYNNPKKSLHKTQKPVELCEWLIKSYTNKGDVVCDFCMGSGTVGVACVNTERQFIGIEKDDKIFELAYNRINNINLSL